MRFSKPKRMSVTPYAKVQRTSRLVCGRCGGTNNGRLTIEGLKVRSTGRSLAERPLRQLRMLISGRWRNDR